MIMYSVVCMVMRTTVMKVFEMAFNDLFNAYKTKMKIE